jgi:hypothetical protein
LKVISLPLAKLSLPTVALGDEIDFVGYFLEGHDGVAPDSTPSPRLTPPSLPLSKGKGACEAGGMGLA